MDWRRSVGPLAVSMLLVACDRNLAPFDPDDPRIYEWPATWELETEQFSPLLMLPRSAVQIGRTYRVRLKVKDDTERWSHWSDAVEFTVSAPTAPDPVQSSLRITELMFNPRGDEGFEFIELQNIGNQTIDLSEIHFSEGIGFSFAGSAVEELPPGEYVVIVRNGPAFASRYDTAGMLIAGEYSGRFSNGGEQVVLSFGSAETILDFEYDDEWYPPADGKGFSLVIRDPLAAPESWNDPASWRLSDFRNGSPGREDTEALGGRQRPGDSNQDGVIDISDGFSMVRRLFVDNAAPLPCEGSLQEGGNLALFDVNGDSSFDLSDAIYLLGYLFQGGPGPGLGDECLRLADCLDACAR